MRIEKIVAAKYDGTPTAKDLRFCLDRLGKWDQDEFLFEITSYAPIWSLEAEHRGCSPGFVSFLEAMETLDKEATRGIFILE